MNLVEQIRDEARLEIQQTVERLVTDNELRDMITGVVALRQSNLDPKVDGVEAQDYNDLSGLSESLRHAADFRTGPNGEYRERWESDEDAKKYLDGMSDELREAIYDSAQRYSLVGSTSHVDPKKDAELVLGGGGAAPLDRSLYTVKQLESGLLVTDTVIGLGSERAVEDDERSRAGDYARSAKTEEDLLRLGLAVAFDVDPDSYTVEEKVVETLHPEVPNIQRVGHLAVQGLEVVVVSAAVITDPYRSNGKIRNRSNTTDTLQTVINEKLVQPGNEVGLVTNAHFRPFQGADAKNILGRYGIRSEVIGFDPSEFDRPEKKPHELLAELLTLVERLK